MLKACVFVITYGCQMNERDSDALRTALEEHGYSIAEDEDSADIVILNTCSIRELAELKAIGKAGHLLRRKRKTPHFKVGIVGCMAQNRGEKLFKELPALDFVVEPKDLSKIPQLLDDLSKGAAGNLEKEKQYDFSFYENPFFRSRNFPQNSGQNIRPSAFVPIQQGCDMRCAYCIVPKTRGAEQNRHPDSILKEIHALAEQGTREIVLLGQIVNKYWHPDWPNLKEKSVFVRLLEKISEIDAIKRIRFMSPHPSYFRQDLIEAFIRLPKLCPHVHLPIQSASNKVLRAMNRPYTKEKVLRIIDGLRKRVPSIGLSTDIIVGFPGETESDFQETYTFFDTIGFEMAYIFKYSPRPGTDAPSMIQDKVSEEVKEARNQALLTVLHAHSIKKHEALVNTTQEVLIESHAPKRQGRLMGRTPCYKKVILELSPSYIGQLVSVSIERASSNTLVGSVVLT